MGKVAILQCSLPAGVGRFLCLHLVALSSLEAAKSATRRNNTCRYTRKRIRYGNLQPNRSWRTRAGLRRGLAKTYQARKQGYRPNQGSVPIASYSQRILELGIQVVESFPFTASVLPKACTLPAASRPSALGMLEVAALARRPLSVFGRSGP
jgi:hypothetical protein